MENTGVEFLKQRYPGLTNSPEVKDTARRKKARTGVEVPRSPEAFIQNYLDRFKEIIEREDPEERASGITALKKILINKYVVRVEDVSDGYWQAQIRVVRERGESGDWQNLSEEEILKIKRERLAQTKEDQQGSLEEWIDYLASSKSSYLPDHLKYWAFQSMLKLERYEKGNEEKEIKGRFPERPTGKQRSVKMFPEVNERALKFIAEAFDADSQNQKPHFRYDISEEAREQFLQNIEKKDFRALYGWTQEYLPPISEAEIQTTEGEWVIYNQNSDPKTLAKSLQGKGSGWCIAGENMAGKYLNEGDLYVYYTHDREGKPAIPRAVIVQKGNQVTEVRGIEWEENIDNYIKDTDIIGDKLKEIPGGERFSETNADTKRLTAIDKKMVSRGLLTGEELVFLYEIDRPIKYFGREEDPRIEELRSQRILQEDMSIVFGWDKSQIARNPDEINDNTKAYVGSLVHYDNNGAIIPIFKKIGHLEHIYTSFPEGRIRIESISIGGKPKSQLEQELQQAKINIDVHAEDTLQSKNFTTLPNPEMLDTVRLKIADLGLPGTSTITQIYARAKELGLELFPAETGLHYALKHKDQPPDRPLHMGMKPIVAYRNGDSVVLKLDRNVIGSWLISRTRNSFYGTSWPLKDEFMFALRKSEPKKLGGSP